MSKDNAEVTISAGSNSVEKADIVSPKDDDVKANEDDAIAIDDGGAKNDVKASLNAIFAKKEIKTHVNDDKSKEEKPADQVGKKDESQPDDVVMKSNKSEESPKNAKGDDTTCGGTATAAVPEIIIEDTAQDASQGSQGMKSSEEKKSRFTFFKKNKKSVDLSVDSETKSDKLSDNSTGSIKSGGFHRRSKTFNPFKSVRKAVNKYRSTRRPVTEVVAPPPVIAEPEPEPIDTEKLEELGQEVSVVQDIRKNRPKGPQGRKRRSMRPCSTADGSEAATPVVAHLDDLLGDGELGVSPSNGMVNGSSLSVDHDHCKSEAGSASSLDKNGDSNDPPGSDLIKSDVGNLASSAEVSGDNDQGDAESSKEADSASLEKEISIEGDFSTSALGNPAVTVSTAGEVS